MDRITLEKIKFGIQEMVSSSVMGDMQYESIDDIVTRSIIKRLTIYLWGNKVNSEEHDDIVHTYPATMWEELKRDFWPAWLKRKFPVRYSKDITHHTSIHYHVCPHLNHKVDHDHLSFMMRNDIRVNEVENDIERGY